MHCLSSFFCPQLFIYMQIKFTDEPLCKYQYTANAPTRPCSDALQCTEKSRITKITFKYTSVPSNDGCTIDPNDEVYCPSLNKAEGGRVWIVENTDKFQDKLSNLNDPITYDMLAWYVDNDLDTAIPPGKTLYDEDVWVGDEFSINVTPSTLNYDELAYFAFDKNGNLITFAILMLDCSGGNKRYQIGNKLGNSEITSFMDSAYGVVTSTVFIDSYDYTVENNCVGTEPATVYSLKRTVSTSSCGEDHWVYSTAEGYNPFLCVAGGEIQLGCSGLPTIQPGDESEFIDSIDGKGPINLLETKISLNVEAKIKYPEYWTIESTPEGGVNNRADDPPPTGGGDTSIDLCDVPALVPP